MTPMKKFVWSAVLSAAVAMGARAVELRPETLAGFERYVRGAEDRIHARISGRGPFLWTDESAERRERVRRGEALAEPFQSRGGTAAPGGLIHDWIGAVFVPGVSLSKALALVQDYDRHAQIYSPEVVASRVMSHQGNHYRVYMRLLKKKILTAVLNTEHEVEYNSLDAKRWYSRSYSVRVAEVENAGGRDERELPEGRGHGFLWRLYSYWRFEERDGGVYIECQAISLTRDIPSGLGWLIEPIVRDLPKESLLRTLEGTRRALAG
jgi:hypothetical protein